MYTLGAGRSPPQSPTLTARDAFNLKDPELSKTLHQTALIEPGHDDRYSRACKTAFVLSAIGGLLVNHLLMIALPLPTLSERITHTVSLGLGIAVIVGVLTFLVKRSYKMQFDHERKREQWEMENFPSGEIKEMIDLFTVQGMSTKDATLAIETMAKYERFFVDLMMMQEIGMSDPQLEPSPLLTGFIAAGTFTSTLLWPVFLVLLARWFGWVQEPGTQLQGVLFGSSIMIMSSMRLVMDSDLLPQQRFGPSTVAVFATAVCSVCLAMSTKQATITLLAATDGGVVS